MGMFRTTRALDAAVREPVLHRPGAGLAPDRSPSSNRLPRAVRPSRLVYCRHDPTLVTAWLLANPAAGRGRARRILPAARAAFRELAGDRLLTTREPGDESRLVRQALDGGCETLVVVGGDGTWSKAAATLVEAGSRCRLVPVAGGTGNDFPKALGLPATDPVAMARLAEAGGSVAIDVGVVEGRVFINSAGFSFDVAALEVAARTPWLGGSALYAYAALNLLLRYRGVRATVVAPALEGGAAPRERHLLGLVVANGARFGGSFVIAPEARVDDGRLDLVCIGDAGPLRRIALLDAVSRGTHTRGFPEVLTAASDRVVLRFSGPPLYEADGELLLAARAEVELRCRPGALRVVSAARPAP